VNTYHIRFNHNHNDSGLVWRVFENGQEHLVRHVKILASLFDQVTVEDGKEKWNLCCYGYMTITDDVATIRHSVILPDFVLPSRINQTWSYSGLDSLESCPNKKHFESYPHDITYQHNSRGYRDVEWPDNIQELQSAIWCIGDSFTVGLGSPLEHTWPYQLQQASQRRIINVSMDGASNTWIMRKVCRLLEWVKPKTIVIQWSYITRDELDDQSLTDEQRRYQVDLKNFNDLSQNDFEFYRQKLKKTIDQLEAVTKQTQIIHSFIPDCGIITVDVDKIWKNMQGPDWVDTPTSLVEFKNLPKFIELELKNNFKNYDLLKNYFEFYENIEHVIPEIVRLDVARDSHHYDIKTSQAFVDKILQILN
jgi:hypothetical protein